MSERDIRAERDQDADYWMRRATLLGEMFERQAAAVRHHTDRADIAERRAAELLQRAHTMMQPCKCDPLQSGEEMCNGGCVLRAVVAALNLRAEAAEAELARIREHPDGVLPWCEMCGDLVAHSTARDLAAARDVIEKYARHTTSCPCHKRWHPVRCACDLCTCGLAAAIGAPEERADGQ